jgi:hypothetical protein
MWPLILLTQALATVLGGVPSFASGLTDGTVPAQALVVDATVIMLAAGAVTVAVAGVVLVVARRRGPGSEMAIAAAERQIEATDEKVAAALQRRTLNRGRVRFDDELTSGARTAPSDDASPRAIRRSG